MGAKGHEKGSEYERIICRKLSLWATLGTQDDIFSRNIQSGGQYTQAAKSNKVKGNPGDMRSAHPKGWDFCEKVITECKHWRTLDLIALVQGKGELLIALRKVSEQASQCKKRWILIARQNNRADLVFMPRIMADCLLNLHYSLFSFAKTDDKSVTVSEQIAIIELKKFLELPFDSFINSPVLSLDYSQLLY